MTCTISPLNTLGSYKFVVNISRYHGKFVLSRHKERTTWETQGGHVEQGETPLEAAARELYEESGAIKYQIRPAFDYITDDGNIKANGMVFITEIEKFGDLPESEIREISFFDRLPENLTYPSITPVLYQAAGFIHGDICGSRHMKDT